MPSRPHLSPDHIHPQAAAAMASFHADVVAEVAAAVARDPIVVVGMRQNPVVKKARQALDEAGLTYTYLEYGSYFAAWKPRLAIKLWSGWPTFPQVFIRGQLIGGNDDLRKLLTAGEVPKLLSA